MPKEGREQEQEKKKDWENPESPLEAAHALASPSIHTNIKSILRKTGAWADNISCNNYK